MKPNPFQIIVVGLLIILVYITLSRKQPGRYVNFKSDNIITILDTSTGIIYTEKGELDIVND